MFSGFRLVNASKIAAALIIATVIGGCGLVPGKSSQQPVLTYSLSAGLGQGAHTFPTPEPESCVSAQVLLPRSSPGFNTARMAYTRAPDQIEYFAFHQWVDTPAYMLQPLLVSALARSGKFAHVVIAPAAIGNRFRLEADDLALIQQFEDGASVVRMALRVRLVDTLQGTFLFDERIALEKRTEQSSPVSGVMAANELAVQLLHKLTEDARAALDLTTICNH